MYKTVRKGDASLQYTIVPQTDQFSSEFPQQSEKSSPRVIKYTIATLLILIILSCVATPFLISQNDQSLFAGTVLAMGRVGHDTIERNSSRSQGKEAGGVNKSKSRLPIAAATATITTMLPSTEAYRKQDVEDEMTTGALNGDEQESKEFPTTGMNSLLLLSLIFPDWIDLYVKSKIFIIWRRKEKIIFSSLGKRSIKQGENYFLKIGFTGLQVNLYIGNIELSI